MRGHLRLSLSIGVLALGATAAAQTQPPAAVEVRPATIPVAPWDKTAEARVVISNSGTAAITRAKLSTLFSNDRIKAAIEPAAGPRLEPGDSFAWKLTLDLNDARVPGAIDLDMSFTVAGEKRARHLYQTVKVSAVEDAFAEKPLDITLSGSFGSVNESRPGRGYLVAVNKLDVDATLTAIRVETSDPKSFRDAVGFTVSGNSSAGFKPLTVPAQSSATQFIEIGASSAVTSGTHRVVLAVDAEWKRHGHPYQQTILVGQDVTLGVFFESELLKALGVPSFLVLPGCLFLFAMQLLLKLEVGDANKPRFPGNVEWNSSGFWIIAITWSALFAGAYARLFGTNYLDRYGARDLRDVWLISIGLGFAFYMVLVGLNSLRNRNNPSAKDDQMTTLEKMAGRGLRVRVPKAAFTYQSAALSAYIVDEAGETLWLVPPIQIDWTGDDKTLGNKEKIEGLINSGSAKELTEALNKHRQSFRIAWNGKGSLQQPTAIPAKDVRRETAEPMVKIED